MTPKQTNRTVLTVLFLIGIASCFVAMHFKSVPVDKVQVKEVVGW